MLLADFKEKLSARLVNYTESEVYRDFKWNIKDVALKADGDDGILLNERICCSSEYVLSPELIRQCFEEVVYFDIYIYRDFSTFSLDIKSRSFCHDNPRIRVRHEK